MLTFSSDLLFADKRVVIIGVPAPFSPICSRAHLPGFVEKAPQLLASGFDMIVCVAASDPWVLAHWRQSIDPGGAIRFLSDGNLEFGQACSLTITGRDFFIGTRLRRFSLVATNNVVERIAVEPGLDVTCSGAGRLLG